MDIDIYFGFGVLVLGTGMICYLGWKGRLDSRPIFILMPAATLAVSALTLFLRIEGFNWLFVTVVLVMLVAFVILLTVIGVSAVMSILRGRDHRKETEHHRRVNKSTEHDLS